MFTILYHKQNGFPTNFLMSRPFVLGGGWFRAQLFMNQLFLNVLTYLQDEKTNNKL